MAPFPLGRALVVGVGAYNDPRLAVPTASRDAAALHALLVDPDGAGYGEGQAELLLDEGATRAEIIRALRRLADRCEPDSIALVCFTCHGAMGDDGLYYLASSDVRLTASGIAGGSGLSAQTLAAALRDIRARRLLLIVNACYAGGLAAGYDRDALAPDQLPAPTAAAALPDVAADELLATGAGRAVITASRADQLSYVQPLDTHSYFGQALLDAFKGGATSALSGTIGLYELYERVYRQVRSATERRLGVAQEPVLTVVQNVGPFPVARYPRAGGDSGAISQRPADDLPVRVVPQTVVQAIGQGAAAINAAEGSNVSDVTVFNAPIDFSGSSIGSVTIGNVTAGHSVARNSGAIEPRNPGLGIELESELLRLRDRLAAARNVDEQLRAQAVAKLDQVFVDSGHNDQAAARNNIEAAIGLLQAVDNDFIRSLVRKLAALRDAL